MQAIPLHLAVFLTETSNLWGSSAGVLSWPVIAGRGALYTRLCGVVGEYLVGRPELSHLGI
jgi:hypothetical protein